MASADATAEEIAHRGDQMYNAQLREKVEADPGRPSRLVTVFGVGYRWDPAAPPEGDPHGG